MGSGEHDDPDDDKYGDVFFHAIVMTEGFVSSTSTRNSMITSKRKTSSALTLGKTKRAMVAAAQ